MEDDGEEPLSDGSSDDRGSERQGELPQNGLRTNEADRCAILYDKQNQRILEGKLDPRGQPGDRLASLCLSRPAFVVRSLREVLEPGELSTAWRSSKGKEASFSCYNRNVLVGVKRLQLGGVTARSEDVRLYSVGEDPGSLTERDSPAGYHEAYFTRADFEDDEEQHELARAAVAMAAKEATSMRGQRQPSSSVITAKRT
ncbi:hypothetical protein BOX15_Mlig018395g1 [Macrostomum lignano]|uniref:Uncharacterized protein n=1 Tax=Macrostomum lignano TaxID=282301 RepID=A0A267ELT3_9PLAT|nr:hypothetical protein BOX15_Mlig018395g1 [Macrostomum lignano]